MAADRESLLVVGVDRRGAVPGLIPEGDAGLRFIDKSYGAGSQMALLLRSIAVRAAMHRLFEEVTGTPVGFLIFYGPEELGGEPCRSYLACLDRARTLPDRELGELLAERFARRASEIAMGQLGRWLEGQWPALFEGAVEQSEPQNDDGGER